MVGTGMPAAASLIAVMAASSGMARGWKQRFDKQPGPGRVQRLQAKPFGAPAEEPGQVTTAGDHHRAGRGREQVENLALVDRSIDQDDRALARQFGGVASFPLGRDGRHVRFSHAELQQQIQQRVVRVHGALPKLPANRRTAEPDLEPRGGPLLLTRR